MGGAVGVDLVLVEVMALTLMAVMTMVDTSGDAVVVAVMVWVLVEVTGVATSEQADATTSEGYLFRTSGVAAATRASIEAVAVAGTRVLKSREFAVK